MDRETRADLLKTISDQTEELTRYKTRLRDVVAAYKGLLKEKEALTATLQALSSSKKDGGKKDKKKDTNDGKEDLGSDPLGVQGDPSETPDTEGEDEDLKEQLATLTESLNTVMAEKSKMESNYQAEKKQIRSEFEDKIAKLTDELEAREGIQKDLYSQVQELKSRLRSHQHEREKEQNDHAVMLRELQKLLADERIAKEHLESQLEDAREEIKALKISSPELEQQYNRRITDLSRELDKLRGRLKDSENKADKPSPLLLQLQQEMADMKAQHRIQVNQESRRANDAEMRLQQIAEQGEDRVCSLESKLSELSEVVGNYERLRYQDQMAIQRLKERVAQLDLENTALARAANVDGGVPEEDSNLDVQALVEKISKLKGMLKLANERSENPVNIEELFQNDVSSAVEENIHKRCSEELAQLKEEFERYKLRAQSVLKTKSSNKDTVTVKEVETYKGQIQDLKEKMRHLKSDWEDKDEDYRQQVEGLQRTVAQMTELHKQELTNAEAEYMNKCGRLETQLHKHRDRTIALLAEKDQVIEQLKAGSPWQLGLPADIPESPGTQKVSKTSAAVSDFLSASSQSEQTTLLHFSQEQARRDVELASLRKQKHQAEADLRELQHLSLSKEEKYTDQIDLLKEEVRKYERNRSRESANLEYLKNVVYHYMTCYDSKGKLQMLNAIATILQFSPQEKGKVHKYLKSWWGTS